MRRNIFQNKSIWKKISIMSLVLLFVLTISYGLNDRTVALPENPITDEMLDSSKVALAGELQESLNDEEQDQEQEQDESTNEDEDDNPDESDEEQQGEENDEQDESDENEDLNQSEEDTSKPDDNEKNKNSHTYKDADGDQVDEDSPNISLDEGNKEDGKTNDYFTTTIEDGEVVTESDYEFRIIHKENEYTVKQTEVFLNGKVVEKFDGKVTLEENENTIGIKVTYEDNKKESFTVTKSYTVHFEEDDIVITTNLDNDKVVEKQEYSFKAKASFKEKSVPLEIQHNGEKLAIEKNHQYKVNLKEGENKFTLFAEAEGNKKEASYTIHYEKKEAKIVIETDVEDETVSNPNYSFYAIAEADGKMIDLQTTVNDKSIEDESKGNYSVTLNEGENIVLFKATHEGKTVSEQYTVTYAKPDGGKEDEEIEQEIKLHVSDLEDGQTLRNTVHTFNVQALDDAGNRLTDRGVSISASNNGESIPVNWSNDAHNSFTMNVQDGTNNVKITAKDQDGNIGTKNLTVQGDIVGEGEPIGHVTLSLEATTIGLGNIIPPTQVELYANERGSETIDRIFEEYGISYEYTGSHDNGFYLAYLTKPGLYSTKPKVPEDLAELVKQTADRFDEEDYNDDGLGEFDFTNGSGWMYSVNGTYPNVGFADYYFKDGDVVRLRYTIALGSDIGGGKPGTNFGKEW